VLRAEQKLPILFLVGCAIICSAQATNLTKSCASAACFEIFASEFDRSKITCNVSAAAATACRCKFQVLDLAACVITNSTVNEKSGLEDNRFNLVVTEVVGNAASSKYTAACRDAIEQRGPCKLEGIVDQGFKITATEIALTSAGVGFEIMSAYQMVRAALFCFRSVIKFGGGKGIRLLLT
jgi:hypothetical protein